MSSANPDTRTPQQLLADRGWRLRNSIWLLGPIVGLGMVTFASFLYIGARARRWDWLAAGGVYAALTALAFYLTAGTEGPNGQANPWQGALILALWAGGIVHALLSNRSWLRWRSRNSQPWYAKGPDAGPPPAPPPSGEDRLPPELDGMGIDRGRYYGPPPSPAASGPPSTPASRPSRHAAPPPPAPPAAGAASLPVGGPADVNTASADELAALPGMSPARVDRVVRERQARRGFTSVAEFADTAGLAPHEHQRLRPLLTCGSARPSGPHTGYGRVLDY